MKKLIVVFVAVFTLMSLGCRIDTLTMDSNQNVTVERTIPKYEEAGQKWGKSFAEKKLKSGQLNNDLSRDFIFALCDKNKLGYFYVHSELKEAFKRGFRVGYEDRTADLVLGPHIKEAAGLVGETTSNKIVNNIDVFEHQWEDLLKQGIDVFIVLISEGSQADREIFINKFSDKYSEKYNFMTQKYNKNNRNRGIQLTQGGTSYILDPILNAVQMPEPDVIKTKFYSLAFSVMGDEWGRRYGTNLVKRDELIDILRRCKPALEEGEGAESNLRYIYTSFAESYRADSEDTFKGIMKEAGIKSAYIDKTIAKYIKK
ncbi:hypothetical protein KP004_05710 [Geomonas oryzisoli]|uniref:Lipoprotein n=1 Tax=Geomonas oryzisoli TaxID=2847992 RepID=A0ABX8J8B1_9BACT|nr:hypothetical protein [Geomonas oryzisoli]QWV94675.1 hypothetical protein KP004_05710 [Geomonas oryzisoli]